MGITMLPTFLTCNELKKRTLRVVDVGLEPERAEIHLTYPKDPQPSAKLRALIDHLKKAFGDPPYWERKAAKS
jgi:DNA-binding transcriptional LysR family regulator